MPKCFMRDNCELGENLRLFCMPHATNPEVLEIPTAPELGVDSQDFRTFAIAIYDFCGRY